MMMKNDEREKRKVRETDAFKVVFGKHGERTPSQQLVYDWLLAYVSSAVFRPVVSGENSYTLDPIFAAVRDGKRQLCIDIIKKVEGKENDE